MGWLDLPRIPEPEVMAEADEVEAYASAAAQACLAGIDDTFVEHLLRLGVERGRALDIGTGPGQLPLKIARRLPALAFVGIDRSQAMLARARKQAAALGLSARVEFQPGDGNRLEFPDRSFDLVICNSVLHHLAAPVRVLDEIARVAKPDAAILLRDLWRPSRLVYPLHVRWHGRFYAGRMRQLYQASVRAAYTYDELENLLRWSQLSGARLFRFRRTHIGLERPARPVRASSLPDQLEPIS
jgi:ubiquinone/menaquinone biosynthesis C-methylase UbiE